MPDMPWKEAVLRVLRDSSEPMHYTEIAEAIAEAELRTNFGATPANQVNSTISTSISEGNSLFERVGKGIYSIKRTQSQDEVPADQPVSQAIEETGLVNAFGMYWNRDWVLWTTCPKLFGQQQTASTSVDFSNQKGVYLLHDSRTVIYVGRTTDQPLGVRLRQHTVDRLSSRWNRFTWFGVFPVSQDGYLRTNDVGDITIDTLIITMEALLIEGLEPPQNRKRGDEFRAVEFLQVQDPGIEKRQILSLIDSLKSKLYTET